MVKSVIKHKNVKRVNISMDKSLFDEIEHKRGMVPRSTYLVHLIKKSLKGGTKK